MMASDGDGMAGGDVMAQRVMAAMAEWCSPESRG